jgi:hypothetical protein
MVENTEHFETKSRCVLVGDAEMWALYEAAISILVVWLLLGAKGNVVKMAGVS